MIEVRLQRISSDDWPLWREVRLEALREAPYAFSSLLAEWMGKGDTETRWRARLDAVPCNLLAIVESRPVGQVSGTAIDDAGQVELISLWVAPEQRGQGVGAALIEGIVHWGVEQGARRIVLSVKRSNAGAIAAYERAGFQRAGPAEESDEWRMALGLT